MLALVHAGLVCLGLLGAVSGPTAQQKLRSVEGTVHAVPALEKLRERVQALPPEKRARIARCLDEFE